MTTVTPSPYLSNFNAFPRPIFINSYIYTSLCTFYSIFSCSPNDCLPTRNHRHPKLPLLKRIPAEWNENKRSIFWCTIKFQQWSPDYDILLAISCWNNGKEKKWKQKRGKQSASARLTQCLVVSCLRILLICSLKLTIIRKNTNDNNYIASLKIWKLFWIRYSISLSTRHKM